MKILFISFLAIYLFVLIYVIYRLLRSIVHRGIDSLKYAELFIVHLIIFNRDKLLERMSYFILVRIRFFKIYKDLDFIYEYETYFRNLDPSVSGFAVVEVLLRNWKFSLLELISLIIIGVWIYKIGIRIKKNKESNIK